MKKKSVIVLFFFMLMTAACALAAPQLTNVTADSGSLRVGGEWTVAFETTEGGALAMRRTAHTRWRCGSATIGARRARKACCS